MIQPIPTILHLPESMGGPAEIDVRAFLVDHPEGLVLVDTGFAPDPTAIADALTARGSAWSDVTDVVLTHDHPDHTGGLARVRELTPAAVVHASPSDRFEGEISPLAEGEIVRGLTAVALPGHTAGHLGLLDEESGALFAGDIVGSSDGRLIPAPAIFTADAATAAQSIRRLADLSWSRLLPSHGPEVEDPRQSLADLIAELG